MKHALLPLLAAILALGAWSLPPSSIPGHDHAAGHDHGPAPAALCVPGGGHSEGEHAHTCNGATALLPEPVRVGPLRPAGRHRGWSRAHYRSPALALRERPPDGRRG